MLSGTVQIDPDRIFSGLDLAGRTSIIAAVSGGSDSLALVFLLKEYLSRAAPGIGLLAVTVDHGLRPESPAEAQAIAARCGEYSIPHRTVRWGGEKPVGGLSAAAREARYRLLAEAARDAGTDVVLTGHTRDDQAETVLMRQGRGDGRGLSGMAPATLYDGRIWIVRPLLDTGREELRAFLHARGLGWIDDPTNVKPEYERVRARREIASDADPQARRQALIDLARRHAAERVEAGRRVAEVIRLEFERVSPGLYRLPYGYGSFSGHGLKDLDARVYALRILLACVGGSEHLPDEARAAELISGLSSGRFRRTLSGAVIDARASGIFLHREFRGQGPIPVPVRNGALWDRRYRIRAQAQVEPAQFVAPLGRERAAESGVSAEDAPASLVRAALAAEPALCRDGQLIGAIGQAAGPHGIAAIPVLAPWAKFLPSFDLSAARAAAALFEAEPAPEPPFAGHIPA